MALRRHFIEDWQTQALTMTALCAQYGVSRKTGYQLVARWEREGEVAW
jgi:transposase